MTPWRVCLIVLTTRGAHANGSCPIGLDLQSSSPLQIPLPRLLRSQTDYKSLRRAQEPADSIIHSGSSSVWTALSPSQVNRERSPSLPPLPSLPGRGPYRLGSHSPSPRQHQRSGSSTYYTALWGSPYELPKSRGTQERRRTRSRSSTLTAEDSPSACSRKNHERRQLPSWVEKRLSESPQSTFAIGHKSASAERDQDNRHPRYSLTRDWLQSDLAYQQRSEHRNWLSDDSGGSDIEVKGDPDLGTDQDLTEGWFDFKLKTPKQIAALNGKAEKPLDGSLGRSARSRAYHRALRSDATLTQQDFDDVFIHNRGSSPSVADMLSALMSGAVPRHKSPPTEKPLPPAPLNRTASESPVINSQTAAADSTASDKRPSISSGFSFQRPRKKLVWKGKTCVIALPLEDGTDEKDKRKKPLRQDEVKQRLEGWKLQGFNIQGFDLSEVSTDNPLERGQSRDIYPDTHEWRDDWQSKNFRVSIPDRMAWENYVQQLQEEKLRALGVSFGDEEPARKSPVPPTMSRQASSQTSIVASMPGAPLSANSFRGQMESTFSPPLSGATTQFGRPQSMVSPNSQQGPRSGGFHFAKQSMAFPGDQSFALGSQFPSQTPPLSNPWSQPQHLASLPGSRGVSPLMDGRRQSLRVTHSPISPLPDTTAEGYFNSQASLPHQLRQQQNQLYPSILPQHQAPNHLHPQQSLQRVLNDNAIRGDPQPIKYLSQPEIASPLPQGHRHNLSATLQKEIDKAEEYHLEESISRRLDEEDDGLSLESEEASKEKTLPNSTVSSATIKKEVKSMSDDETNPSAVGYSRPTRLSLASNAHTSDGMDHAPKSSASKLNVNAQEFVFDPTKSSFTPMFSFGTKSMPSAGPASISSLPGPQGLHSKNTSNTSTFSSNLNVAAPAFTPEKLQSPSTGNREFSFSSSVPVLKADAPSFTPGAGLGLKTDSGPDGPNKAPSKIFGSFNYSDVIKPAKKSKAIPIVKPKNESDGEGFSDGQEDESGRITQADGRHKRLRRDDHSGNQVPLFATPRPEKPAEEILRSSSADEKSPSIVTSLDENTTPIEKATNQLKELVDELPISDTPRSVEETAGPSATSGRFRLTDDESVFVANDSRSRSVSVSLKATEEATEKEEGLNGTVIKEESNVAIDGISDTAKKSMLSATAKPFDFKPNANIFQPANTDEDLVREHAFPPVRTAKKPSLKAGLGASRYAPQESPPESFPKSSPVLKATLLEQSPPDRSVDGPTINRVQYVEPTTYQEIDDVMRHLNGDDSDVGVERNPAQAWKSPARSIRSSRARSPPFGQASHDYISDIDDVGHLHAKRQVATASPNNLQQSFQYLPEREFGSSDSAAAELVARSARFSPSYKPPKHPFAELKSPIYNLNNADRGAISDWDDVVSSSEEAKFHERSRFFSNRVDDLVGGVVEDRLRPLEQTLADVSASLARMTSRSRSQRYHRSTSADIENSDADDEDDEVTDARAISPLRDRKYDRLKSLLIESTNAQKAIAPSQELMQVTESLAELKASISQWQQPLRVEKPSDGKENATLTDAVAEIREWVQNHQQPNISSVPSNATEVAHLSGSIAELKALLEEQKKHPAIAGDIRATIEDAISKQSRGKSAHVTSSQESAAAEKLRLQVTGLESMLKVAETRADDEFRTRRAVEDDLAESRRMLKAAQEEASEQRDSAEETELSLRSFLDDQQQSKQHTAMLEEVKVALEKSISDLSDKNLALEDTLEEYRRSHTDWKTEMENARRENEDLKRTIQSLKSELEDGINTKQAFKDKFERLQDDLAEAARAIARDQASWRNKEEEHKAKHAHQGARLEAEARTRERLELEIDRLEKQEKDAMKSRFLVEQIRGENNHLVSMVNELRTNSHQHQDKAMSLERELHDTKENNRMEIQRILGSTKADVGAANQQVHILRANLEGVIGRLESQLEYTKTDANNAKQRYELMLEEASVSRDVALREAAEAREAALQEHYRFHERTLEETKNSHERALKEMESSHSRTLTKTLEDHQRAMSNVVDDHERASNTAMEDKRMTENYLNGRLNLADEKVLHYQERITSLEERLEIAKSAAQAAAEAARSARGSTTVPTSRGSMPVAPGSNLPDRISPQALRESILVLQEQLHERESQIEKLEQELGEVDREAPNKLKDRGVEISWLRELLGVRLDDLQDIITTLSSPSYDRDAVRDAAIRLKANLQMEQQEKERAMSGGQRLPSLTSITASPRSLPMAAAAAWGNWRKGQSSFNSLAELAAPNRSASQTPSKSSPQSFLSGLLTPPSTNIRQTPQPHGSSTARQPRTARRPVSGYSNPKLRISPSRDQRRQTSTESTDLPQTPTLLRTASYDRDAESGHYSLERYVAEDDENASSADGHVQAEVEPEGIFGPSIELAS